MNSFARRFKIGLGVAATALLVSCGGGGGGGASAVTVPSATSATLSAFVGNVIGWGNVDGVGAAARFAYPQGTAVDSVGNVFIADLGNGVIRKITPAGVVTTFAGSRATHSATQVDGVGTAAGFTTLFAIAIDSTDNLYVVDQYMIRKITPNATVTTLAGTAGVSGSANGQGAVASFGYSVGIAVDNTGTIYLADSNNNTIRKITASGMVSTLAGTAGTTGAVDAAGAAASFNSPFGVATDSVGNVFVADNGNNTIRKITPAGMVSTFAGTAGDFWGCFAGGYDGTGPAAKFCYPRSLAIDSANNIFVADSVNAMVRKITPAAEVSTVAGAHGIHDSVDGDKLSARFNNPIGISVGPGGNLYLVDDQANVVRKITPTGTVSTIAGSPSTMGLADATGSSASFSYLIGLAADASGNIFIADTSNGTIRKATPAGVVSTFAGTAGMLGNVDATGAAAMFSGPFCVATDRLSNLYICDQYAVRKITSAGAVTTLAGTQLVKGSADGTGAAASFKSPSGMAVDSLGSVFVTDSGNRTIRKITQAGVVTTFAGSTGVSGSADGQGAAASFSGLGAITIDSSDNLYVASNRTVRKITPQAVVTTLAGTPGVDGVADGVGAAASFMTLSGIAVDASGNLYVSDSTAGTIRKITPNGTVSTVVGVPYNWSFVPGALPGLLSQPMGLAISGRSLYIAMNNGVAVVQNLP